jgi:2,4-dienoyl-CoA reductase-like NADH-dependent reductase (Old Yellow Enzyme family)
MCQYSCENLDGMPDDWHLVNLGSRAVGGAGIVCTEATAVEARGRISPQDTGLWNDAQIDPFARITKFLKAHGAVPAIQLAHAGRKAATRRPWDGGGPLAQNENPWEIVGPSPIPFDHGYQQPHELSKAEIAQIVEAFRQATIRSLKAGFEIIEIHGAHGYLLDQFLSPLSNQRQDEYGGSIENRWRFLVEVVQAVRAEWPAEFPLFVRISATDWVEGGWTAEDSVLLARELAKHGVDMLDCSSGGVSPAQQIKPAPGYQVPFAEQVRREAGMGTIAVGLLYDPEQANEIIVDGKADIVALARELLRDPYWPLHAARALGYEIKWPDQYLRAKR